MLTETNPNELQTTIPTLPSDVLQSVFIWLSPLDLLRIGLVCSLWKTLADGNPVWRIKNEQHGVRYNKNSNENHKELFFRHNQHLFPEVPPDKRSLFYSLIENDTMTFTLQKPIRLYDLFLKGDGINNLRHFVLENNHPIQKAHIYQQIKLHSFNNDPNRQVQNSDLLYWAILLEQPIEEVKRVSNTRSQTSYQKALDNATKINYLQAVEHILEKEIPGLIYPLSLAAKNNYLALVRIFMNKVPEDKYKMALWDAANQGHVEVVDLLAKSANAFSAIIPAVTSGKLALVKWFFEIMISRGVSDEQKIIANLQTLMTTEESGKTILHLAVLYGHTEVVAYLLEVDKKLPESASTLNIADGEMTPLQCAVKERFSAIVKLLLQAGASPNVNVPLTPTTTAAPTTLIRAVKGKKENIEIVRLLIQFGADIDAEFEDMTALDYAYEYNQPQSAAALVLAGAKAKQNAALLPPFFAGHGQLEVLLVLIDKGVDESTLQTCFSNSLNAGQKRVVAYLLGLENLQIEITQHLHDLRLAIRRNHMDTVRLVMESNEISIFELIKSGDVPTLILCLDMHPEALEARNDKGYTPLIIAAARGFLPLVDLFIERGADIAAVNKKNQSALYVALEKGHRHVADYLLDLNDDVLLILPKACLDWFACIAKHGDMTLMQRLLDKRRSVKAPEVTLTYLLSLAITYVNTAMETSLISQHPDKAEVVNQVTDGETALRRATEKDDGESIHLLLNMGADQFISEWREYPINFAVSMGKKKAINALCEKDKRIFTLTDYTIFTPLQRAINSRNVGLIRYLIYKGADVTKNRVIRQVADSSYHPAQEVIMCDLLLAGARADINEITQVIHHHHLLKLCLEFQPELMQQRDGEGFSLLIKVVEYGKLETVKLLFEKNASISELEKTNALWMAICVGKEDIIEYFLMVVRAKPNPRWNLEDIGITYNHKQYIHLIHYIDRLKARKEEYKWTLTLFGQTQNFGFSKTEKLKAANALKEFLESKMTFQELAIYKDPLSNGDLGEVFEINTYRF